MTPKCRDFFTGTPHGNILFYPTNPGVVMYTVVLSPPTKKS